MTENVLEGELLPKRFGRKPKFNLKYCEELIWMAENGKTSSHFCVRYGLSITTFNAWKKKHKEFEEAVLIAEEASKAYTHDLMVQGALKQIDCNPLLIGKLYDKNWGVAGQGTQKSGIQINNFISPNGQQDIKSLSPEERGERIKELEQKLIKQQKDNVTNTSDDFRQYTNPSLHDGIKLDNGETADTTSSNTD